LDYVWGIDYLCLMEPQDEYGLTHVTLPEFLNTMYDMTGELNLDYGTDSVIEKLRQLLERKKMGGNKGIHMSYEEEGE
jgi:hypothetical protein